MSSGNKIDSIKKFQVSIDCFHAEIHEGDGFFLWKQFAIVNGASNNITIFVPSDEALHCSFSISTDNPILMDWYELGATGTATKSGTELQPLNLNREYVGHAKEFTDTQVFLGSTVNISTDWAGFEDIKVGSGTKQAPVAGNVRNGGEIILAKGKTYVFLFTGTLTATHNITFAMEWYE